MKVSEFLIGIKTWLDTNDVNKSYSVRSGSPEYNFIIGFENNNSRSARLYQLEMNGKYYFHNTVTSVTDYRLKVEVTTSINDDGTMTKSIEYHDLVNMYNGFIKGINNRLISNFGEKAKCRDYYIIKNQSVNEINDNEIKINEVRDFITKDGSVRLMNALLNYDNGLIGLDKLIEIVDKRKKKIAKVN